MADPRFRPLNYGLVYAGGLDYSPAIGALPGGEFIQVTDRSSNLASRNAVARVYYDPNGVEQYVAGVGPGIGGRIENSSYYQYDPTVTALPDGRYIIAWSGQRQTLSQLDVRYQVYGADNRAIGTVMSANAADDYTRPAPQIGALAGGGFLFAWNQADSQNATVHVAFRLFDASGAAVGGDRNVPFGAGAQALTEVATLTGGNIVIALTDNTAESVGGTASVGARALIYTPSGALVANVAINDAVAGSQSGADIVALGDGGFAATWLDSGVAENGGAATGTGGVWFQRFAADGSRVGTAVRLFTDTGQAAPHFEAFSDGSFALTYGGYLYKLDTAGRIVGDPITVGFLASPPNYVTTDVDLAILPDDRIVLSYGTASVPARYTGDGLQLLQPLVRSSDAAETYTIGRLNAYYDGAGGNDAITGSARGDTLDGGTGADTLAGLAGNDVYYVDDVGDVIRENAGEGTDTVIVTGANYLLNAGASVETLSAATGTAAINIAGNEVAQTINGNDGANILSGNGGDDTLNGGLGDDVYRVFTTGTVIGDTGGFDTVYASGTSYFLYSFAQIEYLSAAQQSAIDPIYLVGNAASQVIVGNYGNNTLNGRSGGNGNPDTLIGLFGDDTYAAFTQGDVIREAAGQGNDIVYANVSYQLRQGTSIEALSAIDQSAADGFTLIGNEAGQTIVGNAGANTLDGGGGNDTLIGLAGADIFQFSTTLDATANVDTVRDFVSGTDRIGLATDVFAAVTAGGILASEFVVGTAALDADDRLVYDQATGRLFYDADGSGSGAAILFAQLGAGTALAASDFVAVAPVATLSAA